MKESEAAALWQGYVHGQGTARDDVELALPFSLVWAGKGIKTFTATVGPAGRRGRAGAVRDLGLRGRVLGRPHEEPRARRAQARVRRARGATDGCVHRRAVRCIHSQHVDGRTGQIRARAHRRDRLSGTAVAPDLPRRRRARARAALSAPGRRRHVRGEHGARGRARRVLGGRRRPAGRGQLPRHGGRPREAVGVSRTGSCAVDRRDLDRGAERRVPRGRERRALRHDAARRRADGRRRARPGAEARDREAPRRARHRPHRGGLPARLAGRLGRGEAHRRPPACARRSGASRARCPPTSRRSSSSACRRR